MLRLAFRTSAVLLASVAVTGFLVGPFGHVIVSGHSMEPALRPGDVVLTLERPFYRDGDVVAFRIPNGQAGAGNLVIHRIVGGSSRRGYLVRGDNREHADLWRPRHEDVAGAVLVRIPLVGLVPAYLRTPLGLALLAGTMAAMVAAGAGRRRDESEPARRRELVPPLPSADYGWPVSSPHEP